MPTPIPTQTNVKQIKEIMAGFKAKIASPKNMNEINQIMKEATERKPEPLSRFANNILTRKVFGGEEAIRANPIKAKLLTSAAAVGLVAIALVVAVVAWPALGMAIPVIGWTVLGSHVLYTASAVGGISLALAISSGVSHKRETGTDGDDVVQMDSEKLEFLPCDNEFLEVDPESDSESDDYFESNAPYEADYDTFC